MDSIILVKSQEKSILDAADWFKNLDKNLDKRQIKNAEHILKEINERLTFLLKCRFGLFNPYLESLGLCLVVKLKE